MKLLSLELMKIVLVTVVILHDQHTNRGSNGYSLDCRGKTEFGTMSRGPNAVTLKQAILRYRSHYRVSQIVNRRGSTDKTNYQPIGKYCVLLSRSIVSQSKATRCSHSIVYLLAILIARVSSLSLETTSAFSPPVQCYLLLIRAQKATG